MFPTAVQAVADVHETAFKKDPALSEVGVGWILQVAPSQRSVSVPTEFPELHAEVLVQATPTAVQAEGEVA